MKHRLVIGLIKSQEHEGESWRLQRVTYWVGIGINAGTMAVMVVE